jgi:hypothetical protein
MSQTRGPLDAFAQPWNISINDKSIKFDQILLIFRAFPVNCGSQKIFNYEVRPAEHFLSGKWPFDKFQFETPALKYVPTGENIVKEDECNEGGKVVSTDWIVKQRPDDLLGRFVP